MLGGSGPPFGQSRREQPLNPSREQGWRSQIKSTLFVPDPLPALDPEIHGRFKPEPGVTAERITYGTQFGMRVPAILYLPQPLPSKKIPALVVVNGHGGDKYSWYAFYTGILYVRAGAAVLTFDPTGEGERNSERRSGTRAHDKVEPPAELALRLMGLMITDVMQAISYLSERPEVDPARIGAVGYSLGSFIVAMVGAVDTRLHACVPVGGGNLDGPGEYWDGTKPMCTGTAYRSLQPLGDRAAVIYSLHASRGPTLVYNGTADNTVGIARYGHDQRFFQELQERVARLRGNHKGIFEFGFKPGAEHRPFFVTRPVALWLERQLDLPNWNRTDIQTMPVTHVSKWAKARGVEMDPLYSSEPREGGIRALGTGVPGLSREDLSVFAAEAWEREKDRLVHERWRERALVRITRGEWPHHGGDPGGMKFGPVTLVEQGTPRAVILVGAGASEAEKQVAGELQAYIRRISGAQLPMASDAAAVEGNRILIGRNRFTDDLGISMTDLDREAFRIRTTGRDVVLIGKDDAGTQFAIYTFLEKYLGVRWLWPGERGEVVPQQHSISVGPIDEVQAPQFKWRNRGPGGALWGASEGPTEMRARERYLGLTPEYQAQVALWEKRNRWGGLKIYGGHALGEIFPPEKYAETHPEYYALVDGKRAVPGPDYDYKHEGQVCTTDAGVLRVAVQWVRDFLDRHPEYDGVHVTMNDGGGFCECERCQALDSGEFVERPGIELEEMKKAPAKYTVITDRIFTFVNQIAEEVQKTHPGKYVFSMAYSRYSTPPRQLQLHPAAVPQYCLWSAYKHANEDLKRQHYATAEAWARASARTGIYEYYINGSWPGMHRLFVPQLANEIRQLSQNGIDLYQTQSGDDFAINGINYYVAGKLLWDPSLDERQIVEDFYQNGFGRAAGPVRRFHGRLTEAWAAATKEGRDVSCNSLEDTRLLELFTPALLKQSAEDLAEAGRLAENDGIRRRIEFYRKGLRFTELTVAAVEAAKKLEAAGVHLFPLERARKELTGLDRAEARKLVAGALEAWEQRDSFVEKHKGDYVLAYFWVKYNNDSRRFNPVKHLRELSRHL